ncbi:MAG: hypothetical protein GY754_43715 [bacterium]|nr:hypothetical protein [bacterium]
MKSKIAKCSFFLIILMILGAMSSCQGNFLDISRKRQFWVIDHRYSDYKTNSNAWYKILTVKKAENDHVIVYVDVDKPGITEEIAETLAREFSNTIYPTVTQNFATPFDFDENGKTILAVYDIQDTYFTTYTGFIGGYFFGTDLYSEASVDNYNDKYGASLHTNEGDILYIDCNPADITSPDAWRTISHEFQHLVNASYYMRHKSSSNSTNTWLDEGLAEAANHMCYGVVEKRVEYYNFILDDYIQSGHPLYYWSTNMMPNYSLSYLFFQYLKFQSDAGDAIFKKIIQSQYGDYRAVMDAIADDAELSGSSWGSSSEEQLNRILLRWYATNAGVSNDDKYRYSSDISSLTNPPAMKLYTSTGVTLQSGGGIVKSMNGNFNSPVSGYAYLSVDTDGSDEDYTMADDGKYGNRDRFVAVNTVYNSRAHNGTYSSLPLTVLYPEDEGYEEYVQEESNSKKASAFIYVEPQKIDFNMPPDIMEKLREDDKELQQN